MGRPYKQHTIWFRLISKSKVVYKTGCVVWTGLVDDCGYGLIGNGGKGRRAHRVIWQEIHGAIPFKMEVCHTCDNPPCWNPDHLFLATHKENMEDSVNKGRFRGHCQVGSKNNYAKTNEETVEKMMKYIDRGDRIVDIADRFGVTQDMVSFIKKGLSWNHVTGYGS